MSTRVELELKRKENEELKYKNTIYEEKIQVLSDQTRVDDDTIKK